jgi:hypothetical protein
MIDYTTEGIRRGDAFVTQSKRGEKSIVRVKEVKPDYDDDDNPTTSVVYTMILHPSGKSWDFQNYIYDFESMILFLLI